MPCCLDIEEINADEVPEIFNSEQIEYIRGLSHSPLVNLSGQLTNIIDACNLPEMQSRAVKALANNALSNYDYDFKSDLILVTADEANTETPLTDTCPHCGREMNVKSCSVRLISDLQMIKREGDNKFEFNSRCD